MNLAKSLFLICLLASALFAQQGATLTGTVTSCGKPEADSFVQLTSAPDQRLNPTAETDANGRYKFENIVPGKYFVRVVRKHGGASYYFFEKDPLVLSAGTIKEENIIVPRNCGRHEWHALPDIPQVFISTGQAQTVEQVSKTVDVIDAQQMRDRADFALIESLRTIPGFRVQQLGGFGKTANIKTRGLRNQDTAILLDGIRFRDPTAITGDASPFLSDLTLTSVNKIEVLRGSGSSLYGTNATGGVVDFQTPTARSGTHGQIGGAFGGLGLGRFRGNISHGTQSGKFGITGGVSRTGYTDGIDGDDNAYNTNFQTRIDASPFSKTSISGRIFVSDADVRLNTSPNTFGTLPSSNAAVINAIADVNFTPDVNDPDSAQRSRFFSGQVRLDHAFSDKLFFGSFYQGLDTTRRNTNGPLGSGFQPFPGPDTDRFAGLIHTFNGHFTWSPNGVSRTTAGYEYENERFENSHITVTAADNFSVWARQSSNTMYVQELLSFADGRLQFAGGFRAQFFSLRKPTFLPVNNPTYQNLTLNNPPTAYTGDGSASYFFRSTNTKLRAHVGNGYRVPSLYERFGTFYSGFFGYSNSGDPNLSPERSVAVDAGIEQSFLSNRVRMTGTYFYTDITNAIHFAFCVPQCLPSPDPLGRFGGYYNTNGRIARGIETSADINPTRSTRIFTSYTFTNSDERNPLNLFIRTSPSMSSHHFSLVATQRIGERFWLNFDFVGTSPYLFPFYNFNFVTFEEKYFMYRFKGSRRGDLTAGYTFGFKKEKMTLRLFGTVENVFDQEYYENGFRTAGATGRVGLSFGF